MLIGLKAFAEATRRRSLDTGRNRGSATHISNMDINGTLVFEAQGQSTKMKWLWNIEPRGFLKLLGPIVRRMGKRQELAIWTGLKTVMEADAAPSLLK